MTERLDHQQTDHQQTDHQHSGLDRLRDLRAEAGALVSSVPGPLRRIVVRTADHTVEIEWPDAVAPPAPAAAPAAPPANGRTGAPGAPGETAPAPVTTGAGDVAVAAAVAVAVAEESSLVRAPLVGTFYAAPEPGADPLVAVGDVVEPGQPLAIVEAMKLMNTISAETAGRVVEILAGNGDAVEFEQPLMRIAALGPGEAR